MSKCICISEDLRERLVNAMDGGDPDALADAKRALIAVEPCCEPATRPTVAPAE